MKQFTRMAHVALWSILAGGTTARGQFPAEPRYPNGARHVAAAATRPNVLEVGSGLKTAFEPVDVRRLPPVNGPKTYPPPPQSAALAPDATDVAWWEAQVRRPLRRTARPLEVDVQHLVVATLTHSAHVQAIREIPWIRADDVVRAEAEFGPHAFAESTFHDINDPVGSSLTTGGPPRLSEHTWQHAMGVRRKLPYGANVELAQRFGHKNSNSLFFTPNNQGTAQLAVTFNQPLLRAAGREYNTAPIVLAEIHTQIARDDFSRELQQHIVEVAKAYWLLYLERADLLQRQRHLARAEEIQREVHARRALDTVESQLVRVDAAVARRRSEISRADAQVRNVEARIRSLVNAPELEPGYELELLPQQLPDQTLTRIQLATELETALRRRPEVDQARRQVEAAGIRLNLSERDLLPALNVILESYVSGLEGDSDIGTALGDQFSSGAPSYTAGLAFEVPLGRPAVKAQHRQRQRELSQLTHQLQATLATIRAEVEIAVRDTEAAHRELTSKRLAAVATLTEVRYLENRWRRLPGDERSASLFLDDLLRAHERLTEEERSYARALVEYNVALLQLRRATSTLVDVDAN